MAQTKIEWTWTPRPDGSFAPGYTFNPWIGCTKVAPGCAHCYAEALMDTRWGKVEWGPNGTRVRTTDSNWRKPLQWDKEAKAAGERRRVFCASLADVFEDWSGPIRDQKGKLIYQWPNRDRIALTHEEAKSPPFIPGNRAATITVPLSMNDMRRDLFTLIDRTQNLDWLLLTKRPENIRRMMPAVEHEVSRGGVVEGTLTRTFWPNVWLGASISEQKTADEVIPQLCLLRDLAPILWLSAEPLLGPVELDRYIPCEQYMPGKWRMHTKFGGGWQPAIDWIVVGGESAQGTCRDFDCEWARSIRDQCAAAQVPFYFKQVDKVQAIPDDLMIRQSPDHFTAAV